MKMLVMPMLSALVLGMGVAQAEPVRERQVAFVQNLFTAQPMHGYQQGRPADRRLGRHIHQARNRVYTRQRVRVSTPHSPGTVIIDTRKRFLYFVVSKESAIRYGVGVGRPGFSWTGVHRISRKAEWPSWRPPAEMRKREPYLPVFMPGGPNNPLGARALYIGSTLYRIHGTNQNATIGRAVSSGCIRMRNDDVIDLYGRVKVGTKVIVY